MSLRLTNHRSFTGHWYREPAWDNIWIGGHEVYASIDPEAEELWNTVSANWEDPVFVGCARKEASAALRNLSGND